MARTATKPKKATLHIAKPKERKKKLEERRLIELPGSKCSVEMRRHDACELCEGKIFRQIKAKRIKTHDGWRGEEDKEAATPNKWTDGSTMEEVRCKKKKKVENSEQQKWPG